MVVTVWALDHTNKSLERDYTSVRSLISHLIGQFKPDTHVFSAHNTNLKDQLHTHTLHPSPTANH